MNKASQLSESHRLDAQAMDVLRQVATEFDFFNSVAKAKTDAERYGASTTDAITTLLAEAVDRPGGGIAALPEKPPQRADAFAAHLVWLSDSPLLPGRSYLLRAGAQTVGAMVTELKYRVDAGDWSI